MSTIVWRCIIHVRAVISNEQGKLRKLLTHESFPFSRLLTSRQYHFFLSNESVLLTAGTRSQNEKDIIKDWRDKAGEMRGAVAGLCLQKIKALQDGRMMDGRESFIHQGLFTSPLNRPTMPSLLLSALFPLKGPAAGLTRALYRSQSSP